MKLLSRLIMVLIVSAGFSLPVSAAVTAADLAVSCEVVAADDDKKQPEGDKKKPEGGKKPQDDEEPECE